MVEKIISISTLLIGQQHSFTSFIILINTIEHIPLLKHINIIVSMPDWLVQVLSLAIVVFLQAIIWAPNRHLQTFN